MDKGPRKIRLETKVASQNQIRQTMCRFGIASIACSLLAITGCSQLQFWTATPTNKSSASSDDASLFGANQESTNSTQPNDSNSTNPNGSNTVPPARLVKFDGSFELLGSALPIPEQTHDALTRLDTLLREQKRLEAKQFVQTRPETFRQALLEANLAFPLELYQFTAQVLDNAEANSDAAGWSSLVHAYNAPATREYILRRSQFTQSVGTGRANNILMDGLAQQATSQPLGLLRADAARLIGMEHLLSNDAQSALMTWEQGLSTAAYSSHAIYCELLLMSSEAARRLGDQQKQMRYYAEAVAGQADRLSLHNGSLDSTFWSRANHFYPNANCLTQQTSKQLSRYLEANDILPVSHHENPKPNKLVLGLLHSYATFERGEFEAALVGFKEAETMSAESDEKRLQLWQAKCLLSLGQNGVGVAILSRLRSEPDPNISARANALLGTYHLQQGELKKGISLIEKSLEHTTIAWPNRCDAEADLGLAYLIVGRESEGLLRLKEAQLEFKRQGRTQDLLVSLENQLRYFERLDRNLEATQTRDEIAKVQSSNMSSHMASPTALQP